MHKPTTNIVNAVSVDKKQVELELKRLKDIEKDEDWLGGRLTNWNHAFAIIDWYKGGNYTVNVVEIINGIASVWGQYIDGGKK